VRNYFTLGSEATTTEDWHIFSNGVIVKDIKYEKANGNAETREINSSLRIILIIQPRRQFRAGQALIMIHFYCI